MKVLLIGSGGREHCLAWKLAQSPSLTKLYAVPGSASIAQLAECVPLDVSDHAGLSAFCRENSVDLVVVGPEDPLAAGIADSLEDSGFKVFGPRQDAARLESSKSFAKDFMQRHDIPTARAEVHNSPGEAREALDRFDFPVVVKADGLAAGKGVRICRTRAEAEVTIDDYLTGAFGDLRLGSTKSALDVLKHEAPWTGIIFYRTPDTQNMLVRPANVTTALGVSGPMAKRR